LRLQNGLEALAVNGEMPDWEVGKDRGSAMITKEADASRRAEAAATADVNDLIKWLKRWFPMKPNSDSTARPSEPYCEPFPATLPKSEGAQESGITH
jgi:hypothetical protein